MKKLIISIVCLLALAAGVSSYVYYRSHLIVAKNELAKANVEALTEDEPIDGGELPEGEIICSGTGYGRCYYVGILEQGLWGNCPSGNPENYCASWWVDFVNLCVYIGGPYGIADDEI